MFSIVGLVGDRTRGKRVVGGFVGTYWILDLFIKRICLKTLSTGGFGLPVLE